MPAPINRNDSSSRSTNSQSRDKSGGESAGSGFSGTAFVVLAIIAFFIGFLLLARNKIKKRLDQNSKSEENITEQQEQIEEPEQQEPKQVTVEEPEKSEIEKKFDKLDSISDV